MSETAVQHFLAEYRRSGPVADPSWLAEQRQAAVAAFSRSGFPTLRHEEWKYTDLRPLTRREFVLPETAEAGPDQALADAVRFPDLDCFELVFHNGRLLPEHSRLGGLPAGTIIKPLADALRENPELLQPHLNRILDTDKNAFTALNTAFMTGGALVHIPAGVTVARPLHLAFLSGAAGGTTVTHPRNLIVMGANARAQLVESFSGDDEAEYLTNSATELLLERGAQLTHYKIQQEGAAAYHVGNIRVSQRRDSRFESHSISLGGTLVRNDIDVRLEERGAQVLLNGLYLAGRRQHIDNHTRIDHLCPHTRSEQNYRGVLDGRARGVFNGKIVVHQDAQKTDARQSNANLLLSDEAEVDTKPELEIYADDVKCSHGASIGRLDEKMLFYLRSRAIDKDVARSLLTFAFADDVISRIELKPVRARLERLTVGRLPDAGLIREFMS